MSQLSQHPREAHKDRLDGLRPPAMMLEVKHSNGGFIVLKMSSCCVLAKGTAFCGYFKAHDLASEYQRSLLGIPTCTSRQCVTNTLRCSSTRNTGNAVETVWRTGHLSRLDRPELLVASTTLGL